MDGLNNPRIRQKAIYDETKFPSRDILRRKRNLCVKMMNLQDIPKDVFRVAFEEFITVVDLSKNLFDDIPDGLLVMCDILTELNMANNIMRQLNPLISNFSRLVLLNLSNNMLTTLPNDFGELRALCEVNLSSNRFEEIPNCVYALKNLEVLIIGDNHISTIDPSDMGLGALKNLIRLDLSNNNIKHVPPTLGNLLNIVNLNLIGNPFRNPRHQILEKGTPILMAFLRNLIPAEEISNANN